jgi:glycoprotein endo-alpha-1,2-mannosidase
MQLIVRFGACLAISSVVVAWPSLGRSEPLVGAYYYPWYGSFRGGHDFRDTLRAHLSPPQPAAIGWYDSRQATTIAAHIDQSHRGNISFWAVSWWGPRSAEDGTFREAILAHPRRAELKYSIHYESPGRLGTIKKPTFEQLVPDFEFLAQHYFNDPNYLRVEGRPVVWIYLTRAYFNGPAAQHAVAELRARMQQRFALDPYLVGDDLFSGGVNLERARLWDAITDFDVYGTVLQDGGSTSAALKRLADVYDKAGRALAKSKVGLVPAASPGFNDKGVRGGHRAAPRYFVDLPASQPGDVFARMLKEVVVPRADPKAHHMLMINSFNEWHEDTQIEPTIAAPRSSADDSADQRYTEGFFYEGYGEKYLKILEAATRPGKPHRAARP